MNESTAIAGKDFLEHYGVKGMKWGVRRARRSSSSSGKTTYQKEPKRLSDAELSRRIKRLELEKKYNELNSPPPSEGKKYVKSLLENSGKTAAGAVVGGVTTFVVQRELKRRFSS